MAFRAELRPLNPAPVRGVPLRDDLGLGCAPIGNLYTPVADADAVATVRAALDDGVRYFDTAPHYGAGESERRLGMALEGVPRDAYVIATKVGRRIVDASGDPVPDPRPARTRSPTSAATACCAASTRARAPAHRPDRPAAPCMTRSTSRPASTGR
jgi:hypothetical protein